jgi:hypothetical protein
MEPKPPEPIPTRPPIQRPRPAPAMPEKPWTEKPLLKSRTIWTIIATIFGFILAKFLGIDGIDLGAAMGEDDILQLGELLLLVGTVVAAWFRKQATGPIT